MAETTVKVRLLHWVDTEANWKASNPVLKQGEIGYVSDKPGLCKQGDGTTAWNSLTYNRAAFDENGKAITDYVSDITAVDDGIKVTKGNGTSETIPIASGGGLNVVVSAEQPSSACIWKQIV